MSLFSDLTARFRRINVTRFNRACAVVGLLFLALTISLKVRRDLRAGSNNVQDFPQYYMAGLIARTGAWDSLYPIPHKGSQINPGLGHNSELRPKALELANANGISPGATRYIQLPPLAILFIPLTFLPFTTAWCVWTGLLVIAAWGISIQAGKIYEICIGRRSHVAGVLILLICFSPMAHRWVRVGNMSAMMGWLISVAAIELVRRDGIRGALALSIGTISKYVLAVLAPMYLVMRRWRTIAWSIAFTVVLVGASLLATGLEPYRTFAREIAPTLGRSVTTDENQSLYPVLLRLMHETSPPLPPGVEGAYRILTWVTLLAVMAVIATRPKTYWRTPSHVFGGVVALITWLLIFSPICWEHYIAYVAPFWGWLLYEATRSLTKLMLAAAAIALSYAPLTLMFHIRAPEPMFSHLFCALAIIFGMAIATLLDRGSQSTDDV